MGLLLKKTLHTRERPSTDPARGISAAAAAGSWIAVVGHKSAADHMPAAEDSLVVPAAGHIPAAGCGCTAVDCTGCENSDWDCIDFGTPPGSAAAADRRPDSAGDSSSLNSAADRSSDAVVDHIDASVAMHWCGRNSSGTELQLPHHWCFQ